MPTRSSLDQAELRVAVVEVQHRQVVGGEGVAAGGGRGGGGVRHGPRLAQLLGGRSRGRRDRALGEEVGCGRGGDALAVGEVEHSADGVADPPDALIGTRPIVATLLIGDVDDAAGVDDVVGRVEHPSVVDALGVLLAWPAGCWPIRPPRRACSSGIVVADRTAPSAHGEKMSQSTAWARSGPTTVAPVRPATAATASGRTSATVRRAPLCVQVVGEGRPDLADAADARRGDPSRSPRAPEALGHRLHGAEHAQGGGRRRVARAAGALAGAP